MNINRYNYEEFFLLYVDNELTKAERMEVEQFVQANPDLEEELVMLKQSKLRPDTQVQFDGKSILLKPEASGSFISEANYEEFFILYADNELDAHSRREVEEFASENPALQLELNLFLQAKAEPDEAIVFGDKSSLYKQSSDERKPVVIRMWRVVAVAAMLLIALGIFWISNTGNNEPGVVAKNNTQQNKQEQQQKNTTDKQEGNELAENKTDNAEKVKTEPAQTQEKEPGQQLAVTERTNRSEKKTVRDYQEPSVNNRQLAVNDVPKKDDAVNEERVLAKVDVARPDDNASANTFNTSLETANLTSAVKAIGDPVVRTVVNTGTPIQMEPKDEVYFANTTANRKLRGLFRKVTRVFEKTTNLPAVEEKGLLIGGFEIALK
ncbi:MAG TPA: hypothetical protein VGD17_09025 [Chitinophagaceae bacterium]